MNDAPSHAMAAVGSAMYRLGRSLSRFPLDLAPLVTGMYPLLQWLSPRWPFRRSVQMRNFVMNVSLLDFSVSHALLTKRSWEPLTTRVLERLCRPGMVMVDVGAQLGYYTLLAAELVGRHGRVVAFEPDRRHLGPLRESIKANHLENVVIAPYAVTDRTGHTLLRVNAAAPLRPVESVRLDEYFQRGDRIDLVKIDIDGGEPRALAGMQKVIANNPSLLLLVEYDRWQHQRAGRSPRRFLRQLQAAGLEPLLVIDEVGESVRATTWEQVELVRRSVNLLLTGANGRSVRGLLTDTA